MHGHLDDGTSNVPLLCYDLSYLGSLVFIWIIPVERTLRPSFNDTVNPLKGGGGLIKIGGLT